VSVIVCLDPSSPATGAPSTFVVEALANHLYTMELHGAPSRRVWAYRKAAWAIEDTPQDLGLIYRQMGVKGLESIENVGPKLAQVVEALIP
jgi:DNA polymerase/3'-5' exonuclease PolX